MGKGNPTCSSFSHDTARLVGKGKGIEVWAGRQSAGHTAPAGSIRINLTGKDEQAPVTFHGLPMPKAFRMAQVTIDWKDMSPAPLNKRQWEALAQVVKQAPQTSVFVGCMMGHGRTGTALSILCHFLGLIPRDADPVAWVRSVYCVSAVETAAQIAQIEAVTGRKVSVKPSKQEWSGGGGYGQVQTSYPKGGFDFSYGQPQSHKSTGGGQDSEWVPGHGWVPKGKKSSSALDDVVWTKSQAQHRVRYCSATDGGQLCPKPAREGGALCDKHFFKSLPQGPEVAKDGDK